MMVTIIFSFSHIFFFFSKTCAQSFIKTHKIHGRISSSNFSHWRFIFHKVLVEHLWIIDQSKIAVKASATFFLLSSVFSYFGKANFAVIHILSMGKCNTILSAYTKYRHLGWCCTQPSKCTCTNEQIVCIFWSVSKTTHKFQQHTELENLWLFWYGNITKQNIALLRSIKTNKPLYVNITRQLPHKWKETCEKEQMLLTL